MSITKEPIQLEGTEPILPPSQKGHQTIGPSHLWDTKEVAAFLNVKESTIRNWVHIGYIPHIKFRGAVRYKRVAIENWIEDRVVSKELPDARQLSGDILRSCRRRS